MQGKCKECEVAVVWKNSFLVYFWGHVRWNARSRLIRFARDSVILYIGFCISDLRVLTRLSPQRLAVFNRYAHSAGPIVDTVYDAVFDGKMEFFETLILCIFGLREYREIVKGAICSRMHESASQLVTSGRSGKFVSIFMFPALPQAICSYSGSAGC